MRRRRRRRRRKKKKKKKKKKKLPTKRLGVKGRGDVEGAGGGVLLQPGGCGGVAKVCCCVSKERFGPKASGGVVDTSTNTSPKAEPSASKAGSNSKGARRVGTTTGKGR